MKTIRNIYYKIFLIRDSMVAFISGIFISVSTGVFTAGIPDSLLTIGWGYIASAIMMFIASVAMMLWAIIVKPMQDEIFEDYKEYMNNSYELVKGMAEYQKDVKKVNICVAITAVSFVASVVLWII